MISPLPLVFVAYRLAERLVGAIPQRWLPALAQVAGTVAWAVSATRRRQVIRNLGRIEGRPLSRRERRRARSVFISYAGYWIDLFRLCRTASDELERRVDAEGLEQLDRALGAGSGAVLATAHLGSWDLGGAWLAARGYPLTVVTERLRPQRLLDWFIRIRTDLGMHVVVRGPGVWDELETALGANRLVVLVADRDLSGRGVPVELFGDATTLPVGPARLARRCDAPLLPVAVYDTGATTHHGVINRPIEVDRTDDEHDDVATTTRRLARSLEDLIRHAPEQWHLMQPNWDSDRAGNS